MTMKLAVREVGDVVVLDVRGRITAGEGSDQFRQAIRDQVAQGTRKFLLNLEEVTYIDSSGLGELVLGYGTVTQNTCAAGGTTVFQNDPGDWSACPKCGEETRKPWGCLKLANLNSQVHELLEFSRLNTVFDIRESEEEALGSFRDTDC
jgi:anti-sigma B factor antagonist